MEQRLRDALARLPAADAATAGSAAAANGGANPQEMLMFPGGSTAAGSGDGGSGGGLRSDEAETQEAAYDRMQAVLAAANPGATPLRDPRDSGASNGGNGLMPRPGEDDSCVSGTAVKRKGRSMRWLDHRFSMVRRLEPGCCRRGQCRILAGGGGHRRGVRSR